MLRRPVRPLREEAAVDRPWLLGAGPIGFGRRGKDIVAHLLPKHLRLPAKCVLVELRHALAVVVGHFEVNDRVHFAHDGPPCRLVEVFAETPDSSQCGQLTLPKGAPALDRLGLNEPLMADAQHGLATILADTRAHPRAVGRGATPMRHLSVRLTAGRG
jgi:hypothetical protein